MRFLLGLSLAGLLVLPGCMSRLTHEVPDAPSAEVLIRQFIGRTVAEDGPGLKVLVSSPFWVEEWLPDASKVIDEFIEDLNEDEMPEITGLAVRIYPLADLAAIRPQAWLDLEETSTPAQLEGLYLGVLGLQVATEDAPETGLLLLRRVDGNWRLAGLIEDE